MSKIDVNIKSEVDTLKKVLVHTPGVEMNLLNSHNTKEFNYDFDKKSFSENKDFLLWDDTIYLPKKQVNLINNGGWHFSSIRTPEELEKKLLNFGSHYEYEESGMDINNLRKLINGKVVMYDHNVDQKGNRWSAKTKLKKIANNFLPNYICENLNKYEKWLDQDEVSSN